VASAKEITCGNMDYTDSSAHSSPFPNVYPGHKQDKRQQKPSNGTKEQGHHVVVLIRSARKHSANHTGETAEGCHPSHDSALAGERGGSACCGQKTGIELT